MTPFLQSLFEKEHFTHQEQRILSEIARDLQLWQERPLEEIWDDSGLEKHRGKDRRRALLNRARSHWQRLKENPTDYRSFTPPAHHHGPGEEVQAADEKNILGRCPVAGAKTRCCNLETLDAVEQCGFGCSYCSIQSFYGGGRIYFHENLAEKLEALGRRLDPEKIYHIGTGQSSDSLMWGNRRGLVTQLCTFARRNPRVILELKSKSALIQPLLDENPPPNVAATWSLNPQVIVTAEEHGTAPLEARLRAARRAADAGMKVGFHFHPMILFEGWQKAYGQLFQDVQNRFSPEETVMVSFGTLTFIKPVLKQIRESGLSTRVHQIPLAEAAGKLSYPLETKEELFSFAYRAFSPAWRESVFFYLCMEDPSLWEPVFGRRYPDNDAFEADMKERYARKMGILN